MIIIIVIIIIIVLGSLISEVKHEEEKTKKWMRKRMVWQRMFRSLGVYFYRP